MHQIAHSVQAHQRSVRRQNHIKTANNGSLSNDLRTLVINFQSIKNKISQFNNLCESFNPQIVLGNETWLNKNISNCEIFPSYTVYRRDREDGYGGVLTAIKSDMHHEVLEIDQRLEACFIKVLTPDKSCYYRLSLPATQ